MGQVFDFSKNQKPVPLILKKTTKQLQLLEDELLVVFSIITAYLHDVVVEIVEIQYVEEEILVCEQFQKEIAF